MLQGLRTVVVMVSDLDAAKRWYSEVTGLTPYYDTEFYVGFEVGGYELGLHPGEPGVGGELAYWGVSDIDAAFARLIELGATALQPITDVGGGIRLGSVRDPFGNALGVIHNPHFRPEVANAGPVGPVAVIPRAYRVAAVPGDISDQAIVRERVYPVSVARMWALWTTTAGARSWFAPDARIELRVGGPFEILFDGDQPVGKRGSEDCKVLAWLPERMLAITWNAPPHLPVARGQFTQVVIEMTPVDGGTQLRITHHAWPASGLADATSEWPATFAYFERAWSVVLDWLAKVAVDAQR